MRPSLLSGLAVLIVPCMMACGGGSSSSSTPSSPSPSPSPAPSGTLTITILRDAGTQSFSPNPAAVGGQMVVFRNADTITHRVRLNDEALDTGDIAPGATSRAVMMPASGANYHCPLHPGMVGAVNPASGGAPPACEGPYCGEY